MNPQDDPEARIRDLERPLADVASTSELGTGQYPGGYGSAPPPPPPGYRYGTPFPTPPTRGSGGFPWWWLIVAAFVIGLVAIGAGVAVFGSNMFSTSSPFSSGSGDRPNISGGGGTLHLRPIEPTDRPRRQDPDAERRTAGGRPAAGRQRGVSGIGENKTIACNDSVVSVSGVDNTVVITGHCTSLTVSGMDNVVTVDSAESIEASGFDNRVTFKSGSPEINKSGGGNVVERAERRRDPLRRTWIGDTR